MNRTLQLQQDRAALIDGIKLIGDAAAKTGRVFTPEELATIDSKHKEVEAINATLSAEQRMAALSNIPNDRSPIHGGFDMHENELDKPLFGRPPVKGETHREKMLRLASGMGEQLMAVRAAALQPHNTDSRLLEMQKRSTPQGASEQIPADGGFLVYPDFANEIFKIMHDVGLVYPRAMKIPLSETTNAIKIPGVDEQSRANGSRWGGVQMFWQNEADALT